ncbi:MAG TPA: hypothetical protein VGR30_01450 [Candidatus Binatia bacterium]|jgi:hypothetical protein|nr:hypothetical protein [Candidatus Binatia bacterium]
MSSKKTISFIILGLLAPLFFFGYTTAESREGSDQVLKQEAFLPVSAPEKDRLTLVSFFPVILEGEIVGKVAIYDNAMTERPVDYLELYNRTGGLLAVGWFDRFGIQRMAVDRGLLEEADELEGVFIVLLEGEPL